MREVARKKEAGATMVEKQRHTYVDLRPTSSRRASSWPLLRSLQASMHSKEVELGRDDCVATAIAPSLDGGQDPSISKKDTR